MIDFEAVNDTNKWHYKDFEAAFSADLYKFQSRIYPSENAYGLIWYYIKQDGKYIGSVWLEKIHASDDYATLGIFIAYDKYRNKGLGVQAIKAIISQAEPPDIKEIRLHVRENNHRAIACYHKIGFTDTRRLKKANGISVIEMIYR